MEEAAQSQGNRKLVVLGIPWDVDTEGLKHYMKKYGTIDDIIVMKDRETGRSRGFGYVTFATAESAEKALATKHVVNGRLLEVKVATPKEEMKKLSKKATRIFVARIPSEVNEETFRSYFEKFGSITDLYMPKEKGGNSHRGIGFITFESSDSVDKIMAETHEIGGSTVAVDKATPKEEPSKYSDKMYSGAYGAYSPYIAAATSARLGAYGFSQFPPFTSGYGSHGYGSTGLSSGFEFPSYNSTSIGGTSGPARGVSSTSLPNSIPNSVTNKVFVGKLPSEITSDDLHLYFNNFGRIVDVFLPKDSSKPGHRGFAFITFADEGAATRVTRRSHEIQGHQIAVELATPQHTTKPDTTLSKSGSQQLPSIGYNNGWFSFGGSGAAPVLAGAYGGNKFSRAEQRYKPY